MEAILVVSLNPQPSKSMLLLAIFKRDNITFFKLCDKCQRRTNLLHAPAKLLYFVLAPWRFYQWGIDILGPFPIAFCQLKFLIIIVDSFIKWIEAECVSKITTKRVCRFYRYKIMCRLGLPGIIISDNGTQFTSADVIDYARKLEHKPNSYPLLTHRRKDK